MKRYTLSGASALHHTPEHPERTASRSASGFLNFDRIYQVWPNRPSMARTIRMQQNREHRQDDWRACVPLRETEGY